MKSIETRYATKVVNNRFYGNIEVKRIGPKKRLPRKVKKDLKKAFGSNAYSICLDNKTLYSLGAGYVFMPYILETV